VQASMICTRVLHKQDLYDLKINYLLYEN